MHNSDKCWRYFSNLIILLLFLPVLALQGATIQSVQEKTNSNLELPKIRFHKPKLTLQSALQKAEKFIEINKIPIEDY